MGIVDYLTESDKNHSKSIKLYKKKMTKALKNLTDEGIEKWSDNDDNTQTAIKIVTWMAEIIRQMEKMK